MGSRVGPDGIGPEPEVRPSGAPIALPQIPAFDLPPRKGSGPSIKELRVRGKQYLDTAVTIEGVVTFAYDCVTANLKPGQTDGEGRPKGDR